MALDHNHSAGTGDHVGDHNLIDTALGLKADLVNGTVPANQLPSATSTPSATTTVEGTVKLAGDLAGTSALPTVPGLAGKAASDLSNVTPATGRTALGLGTAATQPSTAFEAAGSVATASTADRARANHTGTQSADTLTDGTTNVAYLATERTKLAGVATAATANATDAQLRDRSTHTGTQAASTVTGLATVATSGVYTDLTSRPTLGTLAAKSAVAVPTDVTATGTASATTFLRGDGAWATPAGGVGGTSLPWPAYPSGRYTWHSPSGTAAPGNGSLVLIRVPVGVAATFNYLGVSISTAGSAGAVGRLGIYTEANGIPSALVLDAGTVDCTTTGDKGLVISQALAVGVYWFGYVTQGAPTTAPTIRISLWPAGTLSPSSESGFSDMSGGALVGGGYTMSGVTAALPSTISGIARNAQSPAFIWKLA